MGCIEVAEADGYSHSGIQGEDGEDKVEDVEVGCDSQVD